MWDDDGAFSTPEGQIPLIRLYDHGYEGGDLDALVTLQSPVVSPWKIPFIRVATNHVFEAGHSAQDASSIRKKPRKNNKGNDSSSSSGSDLREKGDAVVGTLKVRVYVWFTRLIFELIADNAIKNLMDSLHAPIVPFKDVV